MLTLLLSMLCAAGYSVLIYAHITSIGSSTMLMARLSLLLIIWSFFFGVLLWPCIDCLALAILLIALLTAHVDGCPSCPSKAISIVYTCPAIRHGLLVQPERGKSLPRPYVPIMAVTSGAVTPHAMCIVLNMEGRHCAACMPESARSIHTIILYSIIKRVIS